MISLLFILRVKYAFGFPVVAMVSHIPVKSLMAVNDVRGIMTTLDLGIMIARAGS